ncbi:bifunctional NAD(P)H-hydrate repair enzyme [Rickettsiales bacterium]|nr:bifunctional NAD(P)H-hydrate repair enzyme [Rickettsiales bacterium]
MEYILSNDQIASIEQELIGGNKRKVQELMQKAGNAVATEIMQSYSKRPTLVVCGPGNNGGDGKVTAKTLQAAGWQADILEAAQAGENDTAKIAQYPLIIDALFGIGIKRPIKGKLAELVGKINKSTADIISIDIPSGISDGQIMGCAIRAKTTITFSCLKLGHVLWPGKEHSGKCIVKDIGIDLKDAPTIYHNNSALWQLPCQQSNQHKYSRGYMVASSGPLPGAILLAAKAGLRIGTGVTRVLCSSSSYLAYCIGCPAAIPTPIENNQQVEQFLNDHRVSGLLIGPGQGADKNTKERTIMFLESKKPCVLDADAITAFKDAPAELFAKIHDKVVMTPHEGEFARIFPHLAGNKLERTISAAKKSGAVVLLKGTDTIIATPQGKAAINTNAPATLATAGSGDVLAGITAGLLAQGMERFSAACAAVWIHGECANRFGPGLTAEDIAQQIPEILQEQSRKDT